jgi:hypothetical protein
MACTQQIFYFHFKLIMKLHYSTYGETRVSGYGLWPSLTLTPGMVLDGSTPIQLNGSRERAEFPFCPDNMIVMRGWSARVDINPTAYC